MAGSRVARRSAGELRGGMAKVAQLMAYLKNLRPLPERVMTMHGDWGKTEEFARSIGMMLRKDSRALADLEAVRLK